MSQFFYVYGFLQSENKSELPYIIGMDKKSSVQFHKQDGIYAAYCPVSSDEFSEEQMQKNVEDIDWLKERAFHHHEVLDGLTRSAVLIPLSFGTVYYSMESLKQAMKDNAEEIKQLSDSLSGKEEWSLKIYVDRALFDKSFTQDERNIQKHREEIEKLPRGKQFFALKKLDSSLQQKAEEEIDLLCQSLHEKLLPHTYDHQQKKVWERKLSGRKDEMVWNCVYLFQKPSAVEKGVIIIDKFQKKVEKEYEGLSVEATGPWPFYHFARLQQKETKK